MKSIRILLFGITLFLTACCGRKHVDEQEVKPLVTELLHSRDETIIGGMKYVYLYDSYNSQYYAVVNYTNDSLAHEFYIKSINQLNQK